MQDIIENELRGAQETLENFINNPQNLHSISEAAEFMAGQLKAGHKIISCGNGGSHCDAMHFAEELAGKYREEREPLAAVAISDPSYISCAANDFGYEKAFARYVEAIGNQGDILLGISTSGNSPNILEAARSAGQKGMYTIGLTGKDGGKLAPLCRHEIRVPHFGYADRIQEIHIKVIHIFILLIEQHLFGKA